MEKNLVVTNQEIGIMIPPEETLEFASRAARALKQVISLKPNPVIMNGEQYLEMEDWELCGQFYGYTVRTEDAMPVEIDGVKGAKAKALLISLRTGEVAGGAEAYCMRDEEKWNTRPKYEWQGEGDDRKRVKIGDEPVPWFQLASMAQTRAGAKAFRNRLSWVVVLAGYKTTPAEELTGTEGESHVTDTSQHWCAEHNIAFFKRGKMNAFGHPIKDAEGKDTGKWCHEPSVPKPVPETPQSTKKPVEAESKVEVPPEVERLGKQVTEKVEGEKASAAQRSKLFASSKKMGYSEADMRMVLESCYHKKNTIDLTKAEAEEWIAKVEAGATINAMGEWIDNIPN